jgi:hypothetical protein
MQYIQYFSAVVAFSSVKSTYSGIYRLHNAHKFEWLYAKIYINSCHCTFTFKSRPKKKSAILKSN